MTTAVLTPLITAAEYLGSVYDPDVDYVDGYLEERNVGEIDHALVQRALLFALARLEREGGFLAIQELRVQISASRFRVPDVCLIPAGSLPRRFVTEAPLLCIEVLSPEDTFSRTQAKCRDYLRMGVPEVWIFDPEERAVYVVRDTATTAHTEGLLRLMGTPVEVSPDEIFGFLKSQDSTFN